MAGPLKVVESAVVYDEGMAQLAGTAEVAADGSVVAVFSRLTDAIVGNVGLIFRSTEEGKSWQDTGNRLECEHFEEGAIHVAIGMARLSDGRLLLPYIDVSSGRRSPEDHPRHMKSRPRRSVVRLTRSLDNGKTWTLPEDIPLPEGLNWGYHYGKIRELSDGRILLPVHCQAVGENDVTSRRAMRFLVSGDGGKNWPEMLTVSGAGCEAMGETDTIILPDGTWRAVSRRTDPEMHTTFSTDGGATWSPCEPTGIMGHSPSLLLMEDGRLYVAYRKVSSASGKLSVSEGGRGGLGISWSDDQGKTWQGELTLKDPKGYEYQHGHETGMPCMLRMPDGRVMVVFYSYDPDLPYEPEDEVWREVKFFYKRYMAMNILEETS